MLERQYQSDMDYLKAHHRELIQVAQQEKLLHQTRASVPDFKERVLNAAGNHLIAWGRKLKGETLSNDFSQECA